MAWFSILRSRRAYIARPPHANCHVVLRIIAVRAKGRCVLAQVLFYPTVNCRQARDEFFGSPLRERGDYIDSNSRCYQDIANSLGGSAYVGAFPFDVGSGAVSRFKGDEVSCVFLLIVAIGLAVAIRIFMFSVAQARAT